MCDGPGLELEGGRMEDRGRCSDLASERTMAPDFESRKRSRANVSVVVGEFEQRPR